uniref:G-protein coupled receptors family 1 profile domain-containing protein n=1 Tax=Capra hircus TaxID=9925 RepID=A0A452FP73_CAPHI
MALRNHSSITEFIRLGLSADPKVQVLLLVLFMGIYLLTMMGNLILLLVIRADSNLHTPMYFFLHHLSFLDLCFSSVTVPKLLENLLSKKKTISKKGCLTQAFFVFDIGGTEIFLLSVMAYDRYAAICYPLLYSQVMSSQLFERLVWASWGLGSTLLPGLGTFFLIFFSYTRIVSTILSISSTTGRSKAFSTCSSHLTAVSFFYVSAFLHYLMPTSGSPLELIFSVQYGIVTPLANPLIYSLKNKEAKTALRRTLGKCLQW